MSTAIFSPRDQWRLSTAVLLSIVAHAVLLSLSIGGQLPGLPGLALPWKERRLSANDLQVLLMPAPSAKPAPREPLSPPQAQSANPVIATVDRPAIASPAASMTTPPPAPGNSEVAAVLIPPPAPAPVPLAAPTAPAAQKTETVTPVAPIAPPIKAPANATVRNIPTQEKEAPVPDNASDAAQKQIDKEAHERALEQTRIEQEILAAERLRQAELMAEAQREAARKEQQRQEAARLEQERVEAAQREAQRQEQIRLEQLRQQAARAEQAARDEAARVEAERQAIARQEQLRREQAVQHEKARVEAARLEQERAEAARKEVLRQEQAKQAQLEAARQEAIRQEAARQEAIKQEAARQEAAKQEAARLEQAKREQAQREKAKQEEEREERLRAIGRQLAEEAAQRDAAKNPTRSPLPTVSSLRRGWLFGRADPNGDLVQYAEAMAKKIEMNMTFETVRELVKQRHVSPMVTVAVRSDGTVEKVTFVTSSGVPAIDEAIRKVVASQAPYGAFPPSLARQYDVIEIRRSWVFDTAIRLQ